MKLSCAAVRRPWKLLGAWAWIFIASVLVCNADSPVMISPDHPETVGPGIRAAYSSGAKKIVIPPGRYVLPVPAAGDPVCLRFSGMKNFEIDATGVLFVLNSPITRFMRFDHCDGITVRGATFRHEPPPFSQGAVTAVAPDRHSVDIRIATGFPTNLDDPRYYFGSGPRLIDLFDPQTRLWKPNSGDIFFDSVQRLDAATFRFQMKTALRPDFPIVVGDLAAWRGTCLADIYVTVCENMRFTGLRFESATGFCLQEDTGEGQNYYSYCVTRAPVPAGAAEPPLFSSNADAFHSDAMRHGPILENCVFEYMDDDGIPIHGTYLPVVRVDGAAITLATQSGDPDRLRPGDHLRLYDANETLVGEAIIAKTTRLPDMKASPELLRTFEAFLRFETHLAFFRVELDHAVPILPMGCVVNSDMLGNGFIVRHCTIRNSRARGMLIKASDGLIEDNVVEGTCLGGICLAPEMAYWPESDFCRHVILRHNVIRHVAIWNEKGTWAAGAMTIAENIHNHYVALPGGHQDITVENNSFEDNDGVNVLISSGENLLFKNNNFLRPMSHPSQRGDGADVPTDALWWVTESNNIRFEHNSISQQGSFLGKVLKKTSTAQNVSSDTETKQ